MERSTSKINEIDETERGIGRWAANSQRQIQESEPKRKVPLLSCVCVCVCTLFLLLFSWQNALHFYFLCRSLRPKKNGSIMEKKNY